MKSNELYNAAEGASAENLELEAATTNLMSLGRRLKSRTRNMFPAIEDEEALKRLIEACNEVGQELIDALEQLKLKSSSHRWKIVRQALKNIWGEEKLDGLSNRLGRYREDLVVLLLVITRYVSK